VTDASIGRALEKLGAGQNLSAEEAQAAVGAIVEGLASEAAVAAFLTGIRVKGETAEELTGAVRAIRERMTRLEGPFPTILDTCGTGGDRANTVNISTAAAIVAAACGVPVAKHGNRSASGNSGSAEVLTELGVAIDAPPSIVRLCLLEGGITFLFAPKFHPALRHVAAVRKQLPFRTLFNLVGPLANPACPEYQLVGVPGKPHAEMVARALAELGVRRAAVAVGSDGLDEVTLGAATEVLWVEYGRVESRTWVPDDFGLPTTDRSELQVSGPAESAERIRAMLRGEAGSIRDVVIANSAAALLVAGRAASLREGVSCASGAIDTGAARSQLERWAALSHQSA
jgi:anthranilate phosphoribosyltransferase